LRGATKSLTGALIATSLWIAMATVPPPASADRNVGNTGEPPASAGITEDGKATAVASDGKQAGAPAPAPGGGGGGSELWCRYTVDLLGVHGLIAAREPKVGHTYRLLCYDPDGRRVVDEVIVYDPAAPTPELVDAVRQRAEAQLDPPTPGIATNPPQGAQLVGVPTWLWLTDPWEPVAATATAGTVSSTVTATPTRVEWDLGDGARITCDGPGTPYDLSRSPDEQHSSCTHTYTHRSTVDRPDGTYTVTATVHYSVSWTASTGESGELGAISRSASTPVLVREAQATIR
jgi:hypothetical protein